MEPCARWSGFMATVALQIKSKAMTVADLTK
jgi:hypothetical protein